MQAPSPRWSPVAAVLASLLFLAGCAPAGPEPPPPRGPKPVATTEAMPAMPAGSSPSPQPAATGGEAPAPTQARRSSGPPADPSLGPSGVAQKKPTPSPDEAAMARLRSKLKVCYQQELNANPDASGELGRWTLSIDAQGAVKSVKLECSPFSTRMNACVEAAMKSVSFDPGDARQVSAGSCP